MKEETKISGEDGHEIFVDPTYCQKQIDNKILIIDHHFALDQIDIIENCDIFANVVICDTVLKHMNKL